MREEGNVDVYGGITTVSADDVPLHTFKRTAAGDAGELVKSISRKASLTRHRAQEYSQVYFHPIGISLYPPISSKD